MQEIKVEKLSDLAVMRITLDDPEARNAMTVESMGDLAEIWDEFRRDDSMRVAVFTGAGDLAFCTGSNLKTFVPRLASGEVDPRENQEAYMKGDFPALDKPVINAINGDCLGGGMELMLTTDLRIAVPEARFGLPEPRWGLFPGGGGTARLSRQVPHALAMEILLTGELFGAEKALEIGLINRIVDADRLQDEALELAARITRNGTWAPKLIKESVRRGADVPLRTALELESEISLRVFHSDDAREGLAAFAEKRQARLGPEHAGASQS